MKEERKIPFLDRFSKQVSQLIRYREFGAIVGFIIIFAIFSFLSKQFLTLPSLAGIFTIAAELGIISIGIAFLMISGEFDLSVGSIFAIAAMTFALLANAGLHPVIVFFIIVGITSGIGLVNGVITLRTGIPSFITTLGMMMFWRGVLLAISGGFTISYSGHSTFINVLSLRFAGGFRTSALWFIGLMVLFGIILGRTRYGNWVFATGDNKEVARAMGVNPDRVKLINFMFSGLLAGFAGCVNFGRFKLVDPTMGMGMELEAISAAVIGGTLLSGGYGSIVGAFIGAVLIGMVRSGLILAGAPAYWYQAFIGIILIVAAIINVKVRRIVAG